MAKRNFLKYSKALKAGIEYFSAAAGAAMFVFGLITAGMAVPIFITIPVSIGIGLVSAYIGVRGAVRRLREKEQQAAEEVAAHAEFKREQDELLQIARELKDLEQGVKLEREELKTEQNEILTTAQKLKNEAAVLRFFVEEDIAKQQQHKHERRSPESQARLYPVPSNNPRFFVVSTKEAPALKLVDKSRPHTEPLPTRHLRLVQQV